MADGRKYWCIHGKHVTEAEAIEYFKQKAKKLTMAELTEILGYEVEIIK